ncbi:Uncharacterized protein TCM_010233 [Theobroma cacao]|uniref:DUF4283 domain-containing protein n=1 Tax=Theobroma cacao TaxID=3641 RepID=A0A061E5W3_THECC|nr:Uncharacterized protein TCM_010233 [Theobroma cacao]
MVIYHNPSFKQALMSSEGEKLFSDANMDLEDDLSDENGIGDDGEADSLGTEGSRVDDFLLETIDGVPSIRISNHKQAELAKRWQRSVIIDYNTIFEQQGKFTRIAVELDPSKPLLPKFFLNGKLQKIEYEGLFRVCFNFGVYGHAKETCNIQMRATDDSVQRECNTKKPQLELSPFRPWMLVTRRKPRGVELKPNSSRHPNSRTQTQSGSRFSILCEEDKYNALLKGKNGARDQISHQNRTSTVTVEHSGRLFLHNKEDKPPDRKRVVKINKGLLKKKAKMKSTNQKTPISNLLLDECRQNERKAGDFEIVRTDIEGAKDDSFVRILRDFVKQFKLNMLALVEPRISGVLQIELLEDWVLTDRIVPVNGTYQWCMDTYQLPPGDYFERSYHSLQIQLEVPS